MEMDHSTALRKEALEVVDELRLLEMLEPFGEARLVGSVALDLVVKPDIDVHLLLKSGDALSATKEIVELLIIEDKVGEIRISDYLENDSLKIGIDCFSGNLSDWSIDIWITTNASSTGFEDIETYKKNLSPDKREVIMAIKRFYYEKSELRDGLSAMIYRAVLEAGVSGVDEFQEYLDKELGAG